MDINLVTVAEDLAKEFGDLPSGCVVGALVECVDEFPDSSPHFVAQATRARLLSMRGGSG